MSYEILFNLRQTTQFRLSDINNNGDVRGMTWIWRSVIQQSITEGRHGYNRNTDNQTDTHTHARTLIHYTNAHEHKHRHYRNADTWTQMEDNKTLLNAYDPGTIKKSDILIKKGKS